MLPNSSSTPSTNATDLVRTAIKRRHENLLAEPLLAWLLSSRLFGRALHQTQVAYRAQPTATLRELLEGLSNGTPNSFAHLKQESRLWSAIHSSVGAWLDGFARTLGVVQARAAVRPPPPREPPGPLEAWIEEYRLEKALTERASHVLSGFAEPGTLARIGNVSVGDVLEGQIAELRDQGARTKLLRATLVLLHARALENASAARPRTPEPSLPNQAPPTPPPATVSHPVLAQLATLLRAKAATCGALPKTRTGELAMERMDFRPEDVRFEWRSHAIAWGFAALVQVDLRVWRSEIPVFCSCWSAGGCGHRAAALADMLAWLQLPAGPTHVRLAEELAVGAWHRALRQFDAALTKVPSRAEQPAAVPTRVSFRLDCSEHFCQLIPYLHQPLKRGGWSAGTRARVAGLGELAQGTFPNADAIIALLNRPENGKPIGVDAIVRALRLLAGYPHLHLAERVDAPLSVRCGELGVEVAVRNAGTVLDLQLQLDGRALVAASELAGDEGGFAGGPERADPVKQLSALEAESGRGAAGHDEPRALAPAAGRTGAVGRRPAEALLPPLPFYRANRFLLAVDAANASCTWCELSSGQQTLLEALPLLRGLPAEALEEIAARLPALERHVSLQLPPKLEGERVEADSRLLLRLTPNPDGSVELEVRVRPLPGGQSRWPGEPPQRLGGTQDGRRVHVVRHLESEVARAGALLADLPLPPPGADRAGTSTAASPFRRLMTGDVALDVIAVLQAREDVVVEWPQQASPIRVVGRAEPTALRVAVENQRDWFGLSGAVEIGEEKIALAALLDAVRRGARYVEVGPGRFAELAQQLRERLQKASEVVYAGRGGLEVSPAAAAALSDLLDNAGELKVCAEWRGLVKRMRTAESIDPALPADLKAELRPYQRDGYRWLMRMAHWGVGACLADDMGLGKTLQALAALLARRESGPALVVAPTSVCFNWVRECQRFAPGLNPLVFREGDRAATLRALAPGDLLVCSYGLLVQHAKELQQVRFGTLVLDEAQAIKNPATLRARAARDLQADWRVALTGTPMENHLGELWSLLRVLTPGLLGSWDQFRDRFAGPIERLNDATRREALARVVRPFILRRSKAAVAPELPPRTELRRAVALSAAERKLYDEARLAALAELTGVVETPSEDRRFAALAALTRLRQLACHPRLYDRNSKVPSSKLRELVALVTDLREEGHRALVFSQFTTHLALVREAVEEAGLSYLYLDGQTPEAERSRRVDAFQRGEADLFLISLKAGGTGLNLTAADYVIHLDPWWNPAVEDQASDRAHRIGQTRAVTVYRLVSTGTIEEAILSLHESKRDLVEGVLGGTGSTATLSTEELLALIRGDERASSEPVVDDEEAAEEDEQPEAEQAARVEPHAVLTTTVKLEPVEPEAAPKLAERPEIRPAAAPSPERRPRGLGASPGEARAPARTAGEAVARARSGPAAARANEAEAAVGPGAATPAARAGKPLADWVRGFKKYLTDETNLSSGSVDNYVGALRRVLEASRDLGAAPDAADLIAAAETYVTDRPATARVAQAMVGHLRRWTAGGG